jgi:hypothetical protein
VINYIINKYSIAFLSDTNNSVNQEGNENTDKKINLFLVLVPALILFFAPYLLRPTIFSGDEPHYLLVANSIVKDHTLNLRKVYDENAAGADMAGRAFLGANLDHHTALVDVGKFPHKTLGDWHQFFSEQHRKEWNLPELPDPPKGYTEYSVRAVGWPLLIGAGAWITGLDAEPVSKILSHFSVLLAAIFTALSLLRLQCGREIALFGAVTMFLGSSYWIFANTAMAEASMGACLACVIYALIAGNGILLGVVLSLGAWLKFQFLAPAGVLFLMGLVVIPPYQRIRLLVAFALGIGSYLIFNFLCYGQIKPPMMWIPGNPLKAFWYFFLDPQTSILLRNPWIFVLFGMIAIPRKSIDRNRLIFLGVVLGIVILPPLMWGDYQGGYGYPCRLIQPALIILVVFLGLLLQKAGTILRGAAMALVTLSILINLVAAISDPRLTWSPTWLWMQAFFQHLS